MNIYRYIPYTLTLKSPAIIAALGSDPNSTSCLSFIPGSAVRGAVAKALGDPGEDGTKQQEFHDLVLGGKARYLNAYPEVAGRRALRVPVSLQCGKEGSENDTSIKAVDLAAYDGRPSAEDDPSAGWPDEQLKPLDYKFLTIAGSQLKLTKLKMNARLHHQRDRKKGRAWKEVNKEGQEIPHGAIFAFEFLDAGQSFQGMIQVGAETGEECDHIESRLKELLPGPILVGRSRRAGYGGMAAIRWGEPGEREVMGAGREGWQPVSEDIPAEKQFRLLLTSACIVRNPQTGQVDPAALENNLQELLVNRAKLIRKRWSFETVGSFNRKWRLETPQVPAVAAGSVFVFQTAQTIPFPELVRLEHEGLGERKEEGYGRILFLDSPKETVFLYMPDKIKKSREEINQSSKDSVFQSKPDMPTQHGTDNGQPSPLVRTIEAAILNAQILRMIEKKAADLAQSAKNLPSNSLLGRLRTPLRGNPEDAIKTLNAWLSNHNDAEKLKQPAMDQLEHCRMDGNRKLAQWIKDVIEDAGWGENEKESETVRDWLKVEVLAQEYHIVSEESAARSLRGKSKEYTVKLIDAVLAGMAIRNKSMEADDEQ